MKPLLNRLRIRLVLLYLAVGLVLAGAIGGGTYTLVNYYLRQTNDEALRLKMGLQFASLHMPLPIDLYDSLVNAGLVTSGNSPQLNLENNDTDHDLENAEETTSLQNVPHEKVEVSELADIVVLPLTIEGSPIQGAVVTNSWLPIDKNAIASAIISGSDVRTIHLSDGTPVRLLTYRVPITNEIGIIQVARSLKAQQAMMNNLMNGMIIIGAISILLLGAGAWFFAGRSIKPMQIAWERQQTFVANASHELRTPLTLIHAGVEVAQRGATTDSQKQVLDDVIIDANYMTKLIENLLLLSRLDAHHLALETQPIPLPALLEEIVRQNERVLKGCDVKLSYESEPLTVLADPIRLKQVLLILIDNAVRNNQSGGWVKINAQSHHGKAEIEVADNGTGIPADQLPKVFDRFYKVNDHSSPDYRGSGLGLSIAQGLVQAQGGTIEVASELGKGTKVTFAIPLAKTLAESQKTLEKVKED
jgi:signal transduction histidine kinase